MAFNAVLYNIINKLKKFINEKFKEYDEKLLTPQNLDQKIANNINPTPGAITYYEGQLMFYDISSAPPDAYDLGKVTNVDVNDNIATVYTDSDSNYDKIRPEDYYIVKREKNGEEVDIHQPYRITEIDKDNKKLVLEPVSLKTFEIDTSISPDIQTDDKVYLAGTWRTVVSDPTQI
jgi:hypothetical protein